jgi:threonine/homoserine/homoserine lactone efflux protein
MDLITVGFFALLISFLGQLPLGNMNITATQLSVQEGLKQAWRFGLGVAIVEVIYLRFSLIGMNWVLQHQTLFIILGWITVILFLILGVVTFIAAGKSSSEDKKGILLNSKLNRFVLGLTISAVNPAQIPFWFIWSSYLVEHRILKPGMAHYNAFTIGAGLGTIIGLALYIHGGKWAIQKMKASNKKLNMLMAAIFIITALIQLYKMISSPGIHITK